VSRNLYQRPETVNKIFLQGRNSPFALYSEDRLSHEVIPHVQATAHAEVFGEGFEHPLEPPVSHPLLESTVSGLVRCELSGRSHHLAPERSIQRTPSRTSRSARRGLPRVATFGGLSNNGSTKPIGRRLVLRVVPYRKFSTAIFEIASTQLYDFPIFLPTRNQHWHSPKNPSCYKPSPAVPAEPTRRRAASSFGLQF
jgi:hypothetical protein